MEQQIEGDNIITTYSQPITEFIADVQKDIEQTQTFIDLSQKETKKLTDKLQMLVSKLSDLLE
jgi:hypothetical protein